MKPQLNWSLAAAPSGFGLQCLGERHVLAKESAVGLSAGGGGGSGVS